MLLDVYAHLIADFAVAGRIDAEAEIVKAREIVRGEQERPAVRQRA